MRKQNRQKMTLNLILILAAILGLFFVSPVEAKGRVKTVKIDFTKPTSQVLTFEPLVIKGTIKK